MHDGEELVSALDDMPLSIHEPSGAYCPESTISASSIYMQLLGFGVHRFISQTSSQEATVRASKEQLVTIIIVGKLDMVMYAHKAN